DVEERARGPAVLVQVRDARGAGELGRAGETGAAVCGDGVAEVEVDLLRGGGAGEAGARRARGLGVEGAVGGEAEAAGGDLGRCPGGAATLAAVDHRVPGPAAAAVVDEVDVGAVGVAQRVVDGRRGLEIRRRARLGRVPGHRRARGVEVDRQVDLAG